MFLSLIHIFSFQGAPVTLNRKNSSLVGYSSGENAYSVLVPAAASSLDVTFELHTDAPRYGDTDSGYEISVNGERVPSGGTLAAKLNGREEPELLTIELTNRKNKTAKTIYTIEVQKAATTAVTFEMTPTNGQIYIYECVSGNRSWPQTGRTYAPVSYTHLLQSSGISKRQSCCSPFCWRLCCSLFCSRGIRY